MPSLSNSKAIFSPKGDDTHGLYLRYRHAGLGKTRYQIQGNEEKIDGNSVLFEGILQNDVLLSRGADRDRGHVQVQKFFDLLDILLGRLGHLLPLSDAR